MSAAGGLSASDERPRSSSKVRSLRLSGGSFKGRFVGGGGSSIASSTSNPTSPTYQPSKERYASGGSSSSLSSTSSSLTQASAHGGLSSAGSSRSSLNRIASSASNIQSYASRYIESIRPKSWGKTSTSTTASSSSGAAGGAPGTASGAGNTLCAPPTGANVSRSAGNSRAESPQGGIPQLLTFRTPTRLSPLPPALSSKDLAGANLCPTGANSAAQNRSELG